MRYFSLLLAIGFGIYVFYIETILIPEKDILIEQGQLEIAELKVKPKAASKTNQSTSRAKAEHKETTQKEIGPKTGQADKESVEVVDNSEAIKALEEQHERNKAIYETRKFEIYAEIERGKDALNRAENESPEFKERINSSVRTSDADRQAWQRQKEERVNAVKTALEAVKTRLGELETAWKEVESTYNQRLRELR